MRQLRTTLAALMVVLVALADICSASRSSSSPREKIKEEASTTARLEIRSDPDRRHNCREIDLPSLSRDDRAGGLSVRILNNDDAKTIKTRVRRWDYSSYDNDGGWGPKRHSFYERRPYRVPSDYVFPSDRRRQQQQQQQSRPPNRRNSQVNRFNKPTSRRPFRIYPVFPG